MDAQASNVSHYRENFAIVDGINTTFGKEYSFSMSKSSAAYLILIFLGCMIATGLIVYYISYSQLDYITTCPSVINDPINTQYNDNTLLTSKEELSKNQFQTTDFNLLSNNSSTANGVLNKNGNFQIANTRLPKSIRPIAYKLLLLPFLYDNNFTFNGNVTILINISEACSNITLHSVNLTIHYASLKLEDKFVPIREIVHDSQRQFIIFYVISPLLDGKQYLLHINFKGYLSDSLQGLYRSSYNEGDKIKWIATTQFQPTDARRAFPCFDEPHMKATFEITLGRHKNMTSISNMPQRDPPLPMEGHSDYVWDNYEKTVPMSTYLVAFVISDFVSNSNGIFQIWARPSAMSQIQYALDISPKILKFLEDYLGINYPLKKIDLIAIPDFSAGAMENWGLITFRESELLYKNQVSSRQNLQRISHVIAHELAHQWFGNLVTPNWWTDLWLNEGFATFLEFVGADVVDKNLNEIDQIVIEIQSALHMDALQSSHQLSVMVQNPDEINDIFDRISYSKGAALVRMMQGFLTDDCFMESIKQYLEIYQYGNANQDNLWNIMTNVAHRNHVLPKNITVKRIMDTWTLQIGFPLITIERNYYDAFVSISQERFLMFRTNNATLKGNWWVPLTLSTANNNNDIKNIWLSNQTNRALIKVNTLPEEWILANINQTGYYRVNYDWNNWLLIIKQITKDDGHYVFDVKNRAQLIDDSFNLAACGYLDYDLTLNLSLYLKQEHEFLPWKSFFTNINYIYDMFLYSIHFDSFKEYMLYLLKPHLNEIGYLEDPSDETLLVYKRFQMMSQVCKFGLRSCIIFCVQQFESWKNSPNPDKHNTIPVNIRQIVYCTVIRLGDEEEWNFLWHRYLNTNVDNDREVLLSALGCSKEIWILNRFLEWAITLDKGVRKHDAAKVFSVVSINPIGRDLAYQFLKSNWNRIRHYLGPSSMLLNSIIRSCTRRFNTRSQIEDFKLFTTAKQKEFGAAFRVVQQSMEQAEANNLWMKRNFKKIVKWLTNLSKFVIHTE